MDETLMHLREKYANRHIVIAWPSSDRTDYRFNYSLLELICNNMPLLNIGVANAVSSRVTVNRNSCVEKARQLGGTDILWLDGDTKFPIGGLLRLLNHDKDIVCATTRRRDDRGYPVGVTMDGESGAMLRMKLVGFPFMLTKMHVFDKLEKPYFAEPPRKLFPEMDCAVDEVVGEDEYFCHFARKAGFDIWCDAELSTEIGHIGSDVKYIERQYTAPVPPAVPVDERI